MKRSGMRKVVKILCWSIGSIAVLVLALVVYVRLVAAIEIPAIADSSSLEWQRERKDSSFYTLGNNWLRKSESGLYEVYVEGEPFERGVALGKLSQELVQRQERVFNNQINQIIPNSFYRAFLTYFIGWFNRDLDDYVPEENKLEILGVSQAAAKEYDQLAPAYQRILNYHGAHDIGHALQNMSLVGCTSFAVWDSMSTDSSLIIGRNFDFFVGEEFAQDKIVAFYHPSNGYDFMMITWGGMTGVLSGMNAEGLTVTLNAAKSDIPKSAAMPVSILARQILQYAGTINEAMAIASRHKTFVSESFLIGSARDKMAAIIEKSPQETAIVYPEADWIIDTNHFQSKTLGASMLNQEHMKTSASVYRFDRVKELLKAEKLTISRTASILRNPYGTQEKDIGVGNEKTINQLIAHHSIIFQPEKRLVWVSTHPWQLGKYVAYDLNTIFALHKTDNREIYDAVLTIPADSAFSSQQLINYEKYFSYRFAFQPHKPIFPDSLIVWNPELYHTYMLAGDHEFEKKQYARAAEFYKIGLTKEIATQQERKYMEDRLTTCNTKLK